ncbi:hypothetical protein [Oribacterium sp. NK2B42]|uniref:hypothetical protein n=1 Tax=Oribacterium sp. NK2B42 TaxID=689781 RepID=UPI000422AF49|nr:hypothetical protein [Oribacterium sp. NK2B42]
MDNSFKAGWDYTSKQLGAGMAAQTSEKFISAIDESVCKLVDEMNVLGKNGLETKQLKGFVAEHWHAGTFNIRAALRESSNRATVEGSIRHASVDVSTNFGSDYSLKYIRTAEASVDSQAKNVLQAYHEYLRKPRKGEAISLAEYLEKYGYAKNKNIGKLISDYKKVLESNKDTNLTLEQYIKIHAGEYDIKTLLMSVYNGQHRLIPTDQLKNAISYLKQEIAKESSKETSNRSAVLRNYKETLEKLVDRISDGEGTESIPLTKGEAESIAALVKEGKFEPEDFGLKLSDVVTEEYIIHQALKAGYTASVISLTMQLTPEIFKAIDYLINNKEIDLTQLKEAGTKAISTSAEGFIRGSISSAITVSCMTGRLGEQFVRVDPSVIGALTVLVMDVAKSSLLVAVGKMTPQEMGQLITKELIISSAALAGGTIGQIIAPELPVLGYMLGSLLGSCVAAVIIGVGENCLISFCIDTGFTCFGLVKQDYKLPEETLSAMGLKLTHIHITKIKRTNLKTTRIKKTELKKTKLKTVKLTMVRRGVIGVNTIGYK